MAAKGSADKATETAIANEASTFLPVGMNRMKEVLSAENAVLDGGDEGTDGIIAEMQERILGFDTMDEIFAFMNSSGDDVQDILNTPVIFSDVVFRRSSFKAAGGFFAVLTYTNVITGEVGNCVVGGVMVVPALYRIRELGAFPVRAVFFETSTKSGNDVLKFRPWTKDENEEFGAVVPAQIVREEPVKEETPAY